MLSFENKNLIDDLIVGFLKNELSSNQIDELKSWLQSSKENKRYFDETREIWITARALNDKTQYNPESAFNDFLTKIEYDTPVIKLSPRNGFKWVQIAAVATIAFLLGGFAFSFLNKNNTSFTQDKFSEIVVPNGAKAKFTLLDGTEVTLNAGSKLRYNTRYGIEDREVELSGEGYFKVAKDKSRPFIVKTSHMNVKALGTEFNVKAYPSDKTIETTLVEGSVKIEKFKGTSKNEDVILKPNQKLTIFKEEDQDFAQKPASENKEKNGQSAEEIKTPPLHKLLVKENVKVEPVISWKENKWIIEKEDLYTLATDMERKFDIEIRFESQKLKNFRFTGTLLDEPLEQVLKVMSFTAPINYEINGKIVTFKEGNNFDNIYKKLYDEN